MSARKSRGIMDKACAQSSPQLAVHRTGESSTLPRIETSTRVLKQLEINGHDDQDMVRVLP